MKVGNIAVAVAVVVASASAGYRLKATTAANPVVRQQFVRAIDPSSDFDLEIPHLPPPTGWTDFGYDDSEWCQADNNGGPGDSAGIPGSLQIWSADCIKIPRCAFRRSFSANEGDTVSITLFVAMDHALYFNGQFVGQDNSGSIPCCPVTYDLSALVQDGANEIAIEGTAPQSVCGRLAARVDGPFDSIFSDSSWKTHPLQGRLTVEGSRWVVFNVPGITKSSQVTTQWTRIDPVPCWSLFDELRNARDLRLQNMETVVRQNQVLLRVANEVDGIHYAQIPAGTYRLIVDTIQP